MKSSNFTFPLVRAIIAAALFITCHCAVARGQADLTDHFSATVSFSVQSDESRGEPISPYIFGQFIEHAGRSVYGGIWAEVIRDRKFFSAVGGPRSPWRVGDESKLRMDETEPFVGQWSPQIYGTYLRQEGLQLQKGKSYRFYVWASAAAEIPMKVDFSDTTTGKVFCEETFPLTQVFTKFELTFVTDADVDATIRLLAPFDSETQIRIGTVSLMPTDNVYGMRADTLALLKSLNATVYRWPGGNFASGYNWKNGVGDRDRRAPLKNPAWRGVEHNDFGLDEFLIFCRELDAEPYITVNMGDGTLENAIHMLEYANGGADTPMGKLRVENAAKLGVDAQTPYTVRWWGMGNEMYGSWQIGNVPVADYISRHVQFARAFREKDPNAKLIGVGRVGSWNEAFIPGTFQHMDYLSEHFYCAGDHQQAGDVVEHTRKMAKSIRHLAATHRKYAEQFKTVYAGKKLKIVVDEWNYWYGLHIFGEMGTQYFLKDALGVATGLHEYFRQSDIFVMANYAQAVNVLGAVKTTPVAAEIESTGLVLKLYRERFAEFPLKTAVAGVRELDVQAGVSRDGKTLTLGIVNPTSRTGYVTLHTDVQLAPNANVFTISDMQNDPMALNAPGQPSRIRLTETAAVMQNNTLEIGPMRVVLVTLKVQ